MPRQLFFRHIPVLLLAILLAEFALSWWPGDIVRALWTGRSGSGIYGGEPMVLLRGLNVTFLAVLSVCYGIAFHVIRVSRPQNIQASLGLEPTLLLAVGSYVLMQVFWLIPFDYRSVSKYFAVPLILSLTFKVCAVVFLSQVLGRDTKQGANPEWVETIPANETTAPEAGHTFRTTLAVSLVIYLLLPLWDMVHFLGLSAHISFSLPAGLALAGKYIVSICLALLVIRKGIAHGIFQWRPDSRQAKYSYRLLVAYVILSPFAMILSAIPYGGGHVPGELKLLVSAAQILGLWALYVMLNKATPPTPSKVPDSHNNVAA